MGLTPYYQDSAVRLFCCSWEELLPTLEPESVALIVTSPPYNKAGSLKNRKGGHTSNWQGYTDLAWYGDEMTRSEYEAWQVLLLGQCAKLLVSGGALIYNHKAISEKNVERHAREWLSRVDDLVIRQTIIWYSKGSPQMNFGAFFPFHELLFWLYRKGDKPRHARKDCQKWSTIWEILPDTEAPWHPCSLPRELAARCIVALSNPGETVLDPFAGSATTLVAAKALGRKGLGCEVREDYCIKAAERLEATQVQHPVLRDEPAQARMAMGEEEVGD